MIKADLHIHTCYSIDCLTPLERIIARCLELGIDCVAVADHNTITGALKLRQIAPFRVIVAEEIATTAGEIMGLFLSEGIRQGLSAQETISRIRDQGGLVAIPHPFGRSLFRRDNVLTSMEILSQVDIIEAFNSRTPFSSSIRRAATLTKERGKAASAGSDAHTLGEIGRAYVEMSEFDGPDDFLSSLAKGQIFGRKSSYLAHLASTWAKISNHILGGPSRSQP
ncbi:MAG: PHP domain-containing protein [Dehalococcoidia bacterium]|nr:PHP domain-containing protein [Dehalococcoidia bacterium]